MSPGSGRRRVALEQLLGRQVLDAEGAKAGHIQAVRAERQGDRCIVREWHLGKRAFLERLGVRTASLFGISLREPLRVPWKSSTSAIRCGRGCAARWPSSRSRRHRAANGAERRRRRDLVVRPPHGPGPRPQPAQTVPQGGRRRRASTSRSAAGECFGLLGPNGAGKTTTIEMLEGLTPPDRGERRGLGLRWSDGASRDPRAASACSCRRPAFPTSSRSREALRPLPQLLPERRAHARALGPRAARGESGRAGRHPLRRPEAAAGAGAAPWSATPSCCSSTSPPTGLDPQARRQLWERGRGLQGGSGGTVCSPPTTWTRRSGSATASPSSTTAR